MELSTNLSAEVVSALLATLGVIVAAWWQWGRAGSQVPAVALSNDLIVQNNSLFKDMISSANRIETETQRQTAVLAEVLIVARTQTEVMRGIQTEIIRNNRGGH